MVNTDKLRGLIYERGLTMAKCARLIGMKRMTFYNKMQNGDWRSAEMAALKDVLHMSDEMAIEIFFAQSVTQRVTYRGGKYETNYGD